MHGFLHFLDLGLDGFLDQIILGLDHGFEFSDFGLDRFDVLFGQLLAGLLEGASGLVDDVVRGVAQFDLDLTGLVLCGELFGVGDLGLDLFLGQAGGALDTNRLLLARAHVLGGDADDAVCVDIEGDLNLGHAAGCGGQAFEQEIAQGDVVLGELSLALQNVDFDRGLVVGSGAEDLGSARWDGRVALDHRGRDPAEGLDAERQRCDVEQEHVGDALVADDDRRLERRAHGHGLVGVDALERRLARLFLDRGLDRGDAGAAADEQNLVDVAGLDAGVLHGATGRTHRRLDQVCGQVVELGA